MDSSLRTLANYTLASQSAWKSSSLSACHLLLLVFHNQLTSNCPKVTRTPQNRETCSQTHFHRTYHISTCEANVLPHLIIPAAHAELATHAGARGAVIYAYAVLGTEYTACQTGTTVLLLYSSPLAITTKCSGKSQLPLIARGSLRSNVESLGHAEENVPCWQGAGRV